MSVGLKKSIKHKLFVRAMNSKSEQHIEEYKYYKKCLNRLIRTMERDHYDDLLNENKGNLKKLWGILKNVINNKKQSGMPGSFKIGDSMTSDKRIIANSFNNYFSNIGK